MKPIVFFLIATLFLVPESFLAQAESGAAHKPKRIVSAGLCADAWVTALAEKDRITGLTRGSKDHTVSAYTKESAGIAVHDGTAESVYGLKPDLVIADIYTRPSAIDALRRLGVEVIVIPAPRTLAEGEKTLAIIGKVLNENEKSEKLAKKIRSDYQKLLKSPPLPELAAIYRPGGYSPGGATLAGDVLKNVGLRNVNDLRGKNETEILSKEMLLYYKPDYLLYDLPVRKPKDISQMQLFHPAIRRFTEQKKTITFPLKYWFCLSPKTYSAALRLRERVTKTRDFVKK